jgi:nucleotide-binding universal stress UspA family protein
MEAVLAAAALARRLGEPLELVHVFEQSGLVTAWGSHQRSNGLSKWAEAELERRRDMLAAEADRIARPGLEVSTNIVTGVPDEALLERARQDGARLIVIASLGRRSGSAWRLGSIADRLAQTSPVPVLVVRRAKPFQLWLDEGRALRVLAAVDLSASSDTALRWVAELARSGPCEVTAAHVIDLPREQGRLGTWVLPLGPEGPPSVSAMVEGELQARIAPLLGDVPARLVLRQGFGATADRLAEMAEREQADLVAVGTHQRRGVSRLWRGSVSHGLLPETTTNVVCVPVQRQPDLPTGPVRDLSAVVAATDLSEVGDRSVGLAYSLVRGGGRVVLLHVITDRALLQPLHGDFVQPIVPTPEEAAGVRRAAERHLMSRVPSDAGQRGVETRIEVVEAASAADAICQAAERLGADAVCVGSHGTSALAGTLLGSVAMAVIRRCRRPVMLVPAPRKE